MMAEEERAARFRALVLPELAGLRRLGIALTGSRQEGEDLAQETVLRGLRYFDSYKGDGFRAWMAVIMRNVHRDRPRMTQSAVAEEWLENIPDGAPNPEQLAMARDQAALLRGMVAALPEALREVLLMREFGGLSYAQIATALNMPVGTVMSRLSRAREELRAAWFAREGGVRS